MQTIQKQQFLSYIDNTQLPERKIEAFENHFSTIKAELQRTESWREGLRMLDLGCGIGLYTEQFHLRGMETTGVDLDADLINRARERAAHKNYAIKFDVGSSDDLPFEDCSFDVVFANSLLEHVPNWKSSIEEWIRVLAPDGLLWIETTNVMHPRQREFRWLPLYSWWPGLLKRVVEKLSVTWMPALANYTAWPAIHWFSYFQLERFLRVRGLEARDRFDCMNRSRAGKVKRFVQSMARSSRLGRWLAYFLVPTVILAARKPKWNSRNYGKSSENRKVTSN